MAAADPSWMTVLAAVGGALGSQFISHCFAVRREKKSEDKKRASARADIGSQLMILLAAYRVQCDEFSCSLVKDVPIHSLPAAPDFSRVKGDWAALDGRLLMRIRQLPFVRTQYEALLAAEFDEFAGGAEFRDTGADLYRELVRECDGIIQALSTLCDLPSP